MLNMVVLASGRGSNFKAIANNCAMGKLDGKISLVLSDKADSGALAFAQENNIPAEAILPAVYPSKKVYERALLEAIEKVECDIVVLAGYMKILGEHFLNGIDVPVINIHPSILPSFPGLHAQRQALEYGVKLAGCTVHFVDNSLDGGPIIAQRVVDVLDNDTEESLSSRILKQEHEVYSEVLQKIAHNDIEIIGRHVMERGVR